MNKVARYRGTKTNNIITKQPGYIYTSENGMTIVNELNQTKQFLDKNHMPEGTVYVAGDGINITNNTITVTSDIARVSNIPTKTSHLTNDSNFLTSIPVATDNAIGGVKVGDRLTITEGKLSAEPACQAIPDSVNVNSTTLDFCNSLYTSGKDVVGAIFMGSVRITDTPTGGQSDLTVKIVSKPKFPQNPQDNDFDTVYLLTLNSINTKERSWTTMFFKSRWSGKTTMDGVMCFGTVDCPWFANLLAPAIANYDDATNKCGDALNKQYRAATEKYVDDKFNQLNQLVEQLRQDLDNK